MVKKVKNRVAIIPKETTLGLSLFDNIEVLELEMIINAEHKCDLSIIVRVGDEKITEDELIIKSLGYLIERCNVYLTYNRFSSPQDYRLFMESSGFKCDEGLKEIENIASIVKSLHPETFELLGINEIMCLSEMYIRDVIHTFRSSKAILDEVFDVELIK